MLMKLLFLKIISDVWNLLINLKEAKSSSLKLNKIKNPIIHYHLSSNMEYLRQLNNFTIQRLTLPNLGDSSKKLSILSTMFKLPNLLSDFMKDQLPKTMYHHKILKTNKVSLKKMPKWRCKRKKMKLQLQYRWSIKEEMEL